MAAATATATATATVLASTQSSEWGGNSVGVHPEWWMVIFFIFRGACFLGWGGEDTILSLLPSCEVDLGKRGDVDLGSCLACSSNPWHAYCTSTVLVIHLMLYSFVEFFQSWFFQFVSCGLEHWGVNPIVYKGTHYFFRWSSWNGALISWKSERRKLSNTGKKRGNKNSKSAQNSSTPFAIAKEALDVRKSFGVFVIGDETPTIGRITRSLRKELDNKRQARVQ